MLQGSVMMSAALMSAVAPAGFGDPTGTAPSLVLSVTFDGFGVAPFDVKGTDRDGDGVWSFEDSRAFGDRVVALSYQLDPSDGDLIGACTVTNGDLVGRDVAVRLSFEYGRALAVGGDRLDSQGTLSLTTNAGGGALASVDDRTGVIVFEPAGVGVPSFTEIHAPFLLSTSGAGNQSTSWFGLPGSLYNLSFAEAEPWAIMTGYDHVFSFNLGGGETASISCVTYNVDD